MTHEITRDLAMNAGEDRLEIKHLQKAVLHLYEMLDEAVEENEQVANRIVDLENR
jgi:hypothetical protein